ncbi:hypothetical protein RKE38_08400 [Phycicoccus sp. M110.8]|uniref:hypothetical protein n=1 Tax=Phycicoccus sp. M110.8 TaxID=3075433 RepID=UPI0028FD0382|nr:hypothetical protein [Phycicoccus sp. M110.8]MDU0313708.1 hypothetical protein [Phycicoccus sp. M110.8]
MGRARPRAGSRRGPGVGRGIGPLVVLRGRACASLLLPTLLALSLAGCGGGLTGSPGTITALPPDPDAITPTATVTPGQPAPAPAPDTEQDPQPTWRGAPLTADEQPVEDADLGVAFGVPRTFSELDPGNVANSQGSLEERRKVAAMLGLSLEDYTQMLQARLGRIFTSIVAEPGDPVALVVTHTPGRALPPDATLRAGVSTGLAGPVHRLTHVRTQAGPAVRLTYHLGGTRGVYGVAIALVVGDQVVTFSSQGTSPAKVGAFVDRVAATLWATRTHGVV